MKRILAILSASVLFGAFAAETTDVNYGQSTQQTQLTLLWSYELATSGGTTHAVITGVRADGAVNPTGQISVPLSVFDGDNGYVVTEIADGAFADQIGLTSVVIPLTVNSIGKGVFNGCPVLSAIEVDEANSWYSSSDGILYDRDHTEIVACPARTEAITLPVTLTDIGDDAFNGCHRLVSINVPAGVTNVGDRAFANCRRLAAVTFEGDAPQAGTAISDGSPDLVFYRPPDASGWDSAPWDALDTRASGGEQPSGVVSERAGNVTWFYRVVNGEAEIYHGGGAAIPTATVETYTYDPEKFTWIGDGALVVPASLGGYPVTRIGDGAFKGCSALAVVELPGSIRRIGDGAFENCTALTSLALPSGVQTIGYRPFAGSALTSLALPDSLRALDRNPLAGCDSLLTVTLPADNSYYSVVDGILYDKDMRTLVACPARRETATVAATVVEIGSEAFDGCFRLRTLLLPDSLVVVGTRAFADCTRLASVVFPAGTRMLEGAGLFDGCDGLAFVGFGGDAPVVDPALFAGTEASLRIYVARETTGWKDATDALPDSGLWPTDGADGRPIENLDVSAETELKEGDVFTGIVTNGNVNYAYTLKVLADRGVEILAISPKPIDDFTVPSSFESSLGTLIVKRLGNRLFARSVGLLSVTVPNAVTEIGDEVFADCNVLASVTLAHGLRAIGHAPFSGTAIETVELPDTVDTVDGNPILGCDPSVSISVGPNSPYFAASTEGALYDKDFTTLVACPMTAEELTVPASVTNFAANAFAGCIRLKRVNFEGDAPAAADGDDLYLDAHSALTNFVAAGIVTFGELPGLWHLRPVVCVEEPLPDDVRLSENGLWYYRPLADGTAEIWNGGACAYAGASPTEALSVPVKVDDLIVSSVGDGALANFPAVRSVSLPYTVRTIGEHVFTNDLALAEISVDAGNLYLASEDGVLYDYAMSEIIAAPVGITSYTAPETLRSVRAAAFSGCRLLADVSLPAGVSAIGDDAFRGCTSLAVVVFGGDAPASCPDDLYADTPGGLETVVEPDATGWGALPGVWRDRKVRARDSGEVHGEVLTDGTWYWIVRDGVAVLYNNGAAALVNPHTSGAVDVPAEVTDSAGGETYTVVALGRHALYNCKNVTAVTLPESIESIGEEPFYGTKVSTLDIPGFVEEIVGNPGAGCRRFTGFTVSNYNIDFSVDPHGLLYDFYGEELVGVPARADTVVIPAGVRSIRADAFASCSVLTNTTYLGNAPDAEDGIYADTQESRFASYTAPGTTGWDGTATTNMPASGLWHERRIVSLYTPEGGSVITDLLSETDDSGMTWYYRVIDGVAEIFRNGACAVTSEDPITSVSLPETLGGYLVKGLGDGALSGLRGITTVSVPGTYEWLGDGVFSNCTSLASATVSPGVRELGGGLFFNTALTAFTIPDSVSRLDGNPVAGSPMLGAVNVSASQPYFSSVNGLLYDKSGKTLIACPATKSAAALPDTLETIADDAFAGNSCLTEIAVPASVTAIGERAFADCPNLVEVSFAGDAPEAAENVYAGSGGIVTYVNEGAEGWSGTEWKGRPIVVLEDGSAGATELFYDDGDVVWYYRVVDGEAEIWRNGRTAVTSGEAILSLSLPETLGGYVVKGIGDGALSGLTGLTKLAVPDTYARIGDDACSNCTSLAEVNLGNGLETIGRHPFAGTKLTSLDIPDSTTDIDGNPAAGAALMRSVNVSEDNPAFASEDGVLYDKDFTTLLACPATKREVTLPETLAAIGEDALDGCDVRLGGELTDDGLVWTFSIADGAATVESVSGSAQTVTIPNAFGGFPVDAIADGALNGISGANDYLSLSAAFTTRDGVLYSGDGTRLVRVPEKLVLPYTVTRETTARRIRKYTVADGNNVTITTNGVGTAKSETVTETIAGDVTFESLLDNVVIIDDWAFRGCNLFTNTTVATTNLLGGRTWADDGIAYAEQTNEIKSVTTTYRTVMPLPASVLRVCPDALTDSGVTVEGELPGMSAEDYPYSVDIPAYSAAAALAAAEELLPLASPVPTVVDDAAYRGYFRMTATETPGRSGTYTVTAELDPEAIGFDDSQADMAAKIGEVAAGATDRATISTVPGLYYAIYAAPTLDGIYRLVDCRLATGTETTLLMTRPSSESGYFRLKVGISPFSAE